MTPEQAALIARARRRRAEAERSPDVQALDQSIRENRPPSPWVDALQSAGSGIVRGIAGMAMLPITAKRGVQAGVDWLMPRQPGAPPTVPDRDYQFQDRVNQTLDRTLHAPQTTPGEYAQTAGEFIPGAGVLGPAPGMVGRVTKFGVIPGLVSEAAGQMTEGSAIEPWARTGAALLSGGAMALAPTRAPNAVLRRSLPANTSTADINAAQNLIQQADQMGITLTWPEALHKATNGRIDITDVQRVLEQTPGGARQRLRTTMAERPQQTQRAFDAFADTVGREANPAVVGPAVQRAGEAYIKGINDRINAATDHLIQAGRGAQIDPVVFGMLKADPVFAEALAAVRRDKTYSTFIRYMPDDSVAVMNEVRKYLNQRVDDAMQATGNQAPNRQRASVYGTRAASAEGAARRASPEFGDWLDQQAVLRRTQLEPAELNPLGQARSKNDLAQQLNLLFTKAPLQGSQQSVAQAVKGLVDQDPALAGTVVRTHLAQVFDQTTKQLNRGGNNEWGGAAFAATIGGNRQQLRNLRSAVYQLPDGNVRWAGLERLLKVMDATGRRQGMGSQTVPNQQLLQELGRGTVPAQALATAASPGRWLTVVDNFYKTFRLGRNADQLARIITDPGSGPLLTRLVNAKTNEEAVQAAGLLIYQASELVQGRLGNEPWRNAPQLPARAAPQ